MINIELINDTKAGLRFENFPVAAHDALLERITALTRQLESAVMSAAPVATGKLASEIRSFVDDNTTKIAGKVKVLSSGKGDHGKIAALEYGATGRFQVAAHQRVVTQIFGRAVSPTLQMVDAYSRGANIVEHAFLRGPLAAIRAEAVAQMRAAIAEAEAKS